MPDLVPVEDAVFPAAPPTVHAELGFGALTPAAPLHRAWLRAGAEGGLQGPTRLRAAVWAPAIWSGEPRGSILLLTGRTEYIEKYFRVIARLTAMGFWVATLDWRGQGLSRRRIGAIGHVEDFAEYQEDLAAFLSWGPVRDLPGRRALLAHSMGGAIGLRGLVDGRLVVDAAMFSAPFWGLGGGDLLGAIARGLSFGAVALGFGRRGMPGAGDSKGGTYVLAAEFEENVLTSDPEHWGWLRRQAEARPEITTGAPSFQFLSAALAELRALAEAPAPAIPTLLMLGDGEKVVSPEAVKAWGRRAPDATLTMIPGAKHEALMEGPNRPQGKLAWTAMQNFLRVQGF